MIISENPEPLKKEFDLLLHNTLLSLNEIGQKLPSTISSLPGTKLENYIKDAMTEQAVDTAFENSIRCIGGQKFPDITALDYYGVEVKTTTQNHWKTTGNSVLESSRIEKIERIYMMFAKLATPVEFKCRPYEECLSAVVVTHSPRYLIDMNLEEGNTIFDKMEIHYDELRRKDNPIKSVVEYYKKQLKPGQELWWMDSEKSKAPSIVIEPWRDIKIRQKEEYKNKARILFPELFGKSPNKYLRIGTWLITSEGIICLNVRDQFSAGGNVAFYKLKGKIYINVPRTLVNLFNNISEILELFNNISPEELYEYWEEKVPQNQILNYWINSVSDHASTNSISKHLDVKAMLNDLIFK